jgi:CRISPR-associated exonuclease Cas4
MCGGPSVVDHPMIWLLLCSLLILAIGFLLRWSARSSANSLGLEGQVIAGAGSNANLFVSDKYGIVGKPDYITDQDGELVPIERKSRSIKGRPFEGEILQLAAYGLLIEERFGKPVRRGVLQYQNASVDIAFDEQLRSKLLTAISALKEAQCLSDVSRDHHHPARCKACGFRNSCPDVLVS